MTRKLRKLARSKQLGEKMAEILHDLPWKADVIQEAIPHRYPFLLVDRVTEVVDGEKVVAIKNISMSDPNLQGHFPGNPIFPGVFIVEGLAQAAAILGYASKGAALESCLLTGVKNAKFRKPVIPGDTLTYEVEVLKSKGAFYWFKATGLVDGNIVAQCELSAQIS
jgi:3-hydroxyacyl-[acyl-carrier-protein] dehydratase